MNRRVAFVYMNNEQNVGRGAGYVAASLMRAGHSVSFFDTLYTPGKKIVASLQKENADVLMVSSMTMTFPDALHLIRSIKQKITVPTILGGIHPTIIGPKVLEDYPEVDYLCIGEGESMIVEFLKYFNTDKMFGIQNLVYRRNGKIISNPIRQAEDLSQLPNFPWHFFPKQSIVQRSDGFLYVDATRGCPYNCTYCSNSIYMKLYGGKYLRYKPVERVIEELRFLRTKYKPRLFYFGDEMILSNVDYAAKLFYSVKKHIDVPYGCMARVERINSETVGILRETGCRYMAMGVECGDEEFRKEHLNRRMTNEQIEKAFLMVKEAKIFTTSFNMIGFPFDNDDALTDATVRLNERIRPDFVQISIFYPFPGTRLYERCVELDLIDNSKLKDTREYFNDSILKGVSVSKRRKELDAYFNPAGWKFRIITHPDSTSFMSRALTKVKLFAGG